MKIRRHSHGWSGRRKAGSDCVGIYYSRTPLILSGRCRALQSLAVISALLGLAGCGGGGGSVTTASTTPTTPALLTCDNSMIAAYKAPDANTTITMVKAFKKGDSLALSGTPATPTPPVAANDLCMVKINVGPGNPGPAGASSTSAGIGIEVWLPSPANWNNRVHVLGGGGWAGGTAISSLTVIGSTSAASTAGNEGAVSAATDTGHTASNGSFAMNPDGSINTALWTDFASRGIHEMALNAKALAVQFYGTQPKYSYWDGCSTGGRQGHMEAQANPTDFNGILAGAPAFNWTKFINDELYPEVVMNIDLVGVPMTSGQITLASSAAVSACDTALTGSHDGYISDPSACTYDPTNDPAVLCTTSTTSTGTPGTNTTANCLSAAQAKAMNKIWYGETADGSVPSPSVDNGFNINLPSNQLWYGLTRGANLAFLAGSTSAGAFSPFTIATDQVALNLQNPTIATPAFTNAVASGANGWLTLSYLGLANAFAQGVALNTFFGNINTDNPDLTAFANAGGKLLHYHGLSDILIMPQGSINYYTRMSNTMGGYAAAQKFDRLFLIPGMGHCSGIGSVNGVAGVSPAAKPPLPATGQLYSVLTNWVENGVAPTSIVVTTTDGTISRPLCMYPTKLTYVSGSVNSASSFACK
jgi:Tannase and feruloyl esterase